MVVDLGYADRAADGYRFLIDSYTHELGHAFAFSSDEGFNIGPVNIKPENDFHDTDYWKNIYNQVVGKYPEDANLDGTYPFRSYAYNNSREFFAECVAEYYAKTYSTSHYNPNDLKVTEVEIDGQVFSLYDLMNFILN